MTLAGGQKFQDQKDIKRQVQCYMQQSSGRKSRTENKIKRKGQRQEKLQEEGADEDEDVDELSPIISTQKQGLIHFKLTTTWMTNEPSEEAFRARAARLQKRKDGWPKLSVAS